MATEMLGPRWEQEEEDYDEFDDSEFEDSDDEDGYASDDPERWGPYYWSASETAEAASTKAKVLDNLKFASFKTIRHLNFAGEVLVHFFGLDSSPYQWILDSLDKEERLRLEQAAIATQREVVDPRSIVPSNSGDEEDGIAK